MQVKDKDRKKTENEKPKKSAKGVWSKVITIVLILVAIGLFAYDKYEGSKIHKISVTKFEEVVSSEKAKSMKKVVLYDNVSLVTYELKKEKYEVKLPKQYIQENSKIIKELQHKNVDFNVKTQTNWFEAIGKFVQIMFTLMILFFVYKIAEDFFRKTDIEEVKDENLTFEDVAGAHAIKLELKDIIDFYKDPEKNKKFKEDLPKGILFEGPPGTGKTYIAKALASECGIPFFQKSASDLEGKYVGVGSENIGKMFALVKARAKEAGGAILFLDELDSVAGKRENRTVAETTQTINKLLTEMDGFDKETNVIVVAATNLVESLDDAVVRPGRFDRIIHIDNPTRNERIEVINLYLNKKRDRIEADVYETNFVETLANITEGFSNAELANLVKESSVLARRKEKETIGIQDLREGFTKIVAGIKTNQSLTEEDKKVVAYHEAGHAVAQILTSPLGVKGVAYITITPYGQSLGHVSPVSPESRIYEKRKSSIQNQVIMTLAGRAVEEKILDGDYTLGAASDLEQANNVLWRYVAKFGMFEKAENLFLSKVDENDKELQSYVKEVREDIYQKTKDLIEKHFDMVEKVAEHLLQHESIEQYELEGLLEGTSYPHPIEIKKEDTKDNVAVETSDSEKEE